MKKILNRFLEIGTMNISLIIDNGKIKSCKISGDFFATKDLTIFEKGLEGTKMIKQDLKIKRTSPHMYLWRE
ncbi:lipoate protein ligase C-terminal domain-containing protein [Spiroplasma ixodetis]